MGAAGASEAGSAQLLLGGPDTLSPAQESRNLLKPGIQQMPHSQANTPCWFLLCSISAWPQPSALSVLRQKYGQWAEEMFVTLALEAFSTAGPPSAPLPWLVGRPGLSRRGFLSFPWRNWISVQRCASRCRCLPAVAAPCAGPLAGKK